jgi:hypothetical protein
MLKDIIIASLQNKYNNTSPPFGKYKDILYEDIPLYYLKWLESLSIKDCKIEPKNKSKPIKRKYVKIDRTTCMFDD